MGGTASVLDAQKSDHIPFDNLAHAKHDGHGRRRAWCFTEGWQEGLSEEIVRTPARVDQTPGMGQGEGTQSSDHL